MQVVPDDDGRPARAYSVGLWHSFHAPELAVFGLPPANMVAIIDALGRYIADGARFEAGDRIDGLCPWPLLIRPVDQSWRATSMFAVADAVYGLIRPPCLQIVWPDRDGRFPWEKGFESSFTGKQPLLWLPRDDNPPSGWTHLDQDVPI